jgi:hypothetical protein
MRTLLINLGFASVVTGVAMIYVPAAFIAGGAAVVCYYLFVKRPVSGGKK